MRWHDAGLERRRRQPRTGPLRASQKVDAQTAFARLRRQARNTSRPLPEVAREIIDGVWGSPTYRRPAKPGRGNQVAQEY